MWACLALLGLFCIQQSVLGFRLTKPSPFPFRGRLGRRTGFSVLRQSCCGAPSGSLDGLERSLDWRDFGGDADPWVALDAAVNQLLSAVTTRETETAKETGVGGESGEEDGEDFEALGTPEEPISEAAHATILIVLPDDEKRGDSHFFSKPEHEAQSWERVMKHMNERIKLVSEGFQIQTMGLSDFLSSSSQGRQGANGKDVDVVFFVGLDEGEDMVSGLERSQKEKRGPLGNVRHVLSFSCSQEAGWGRLERLGERRTHGRLLSLLALLPGVAPDLKTAFSTRKILGTLWDRHSSDDLLYLFLVVLDTFVTTVPYVKSQLGLKKLGRESLDCMLGNCKKQVLGCFSDPTCRKALSCLASCALNDQVETYRCITTYESEAFRDFSLCVLQKNNCLENYAPIPERPKPQPLRSFKGEALTHEMAERIFMGHMGRRPWSWKVVAGKNPAYDCFPCQHQLFYRGKSGAFWYDPVFKVKKLDGGEAWRRRHYRVKRAQTPGTFWFSVLDNGVVSSEYWTILDCAEDFSWAVFYYAGAASVAGLQYSGALVCSEDGTWPFKTSEGQEACEAARRTVASLETGQIQTWELFECHNEEATCSGAPVGLSGEARETHNHHPMNAKLFASKDLVPVTEELPMIAAT
uniref:VDE lipocalin domain-containing protein n=1 Tax=Chromera velia CCMP2878 TaxID=1169474 RepID=A0A0G4I4C8_9ALVE|mmetsp:Transcript_11147/g.21545  ORF Transcript_11147/g.21545 Transcript_11147/m.21545 type:complete len:637 (+) Transcript_11147:208-2118(+)|eukprot:Cvel_10819.t1-p1 / transcript=Cvel_10819.t1 / gene=Cvel_10819 / organism=Chromera_velia_CCMP2878 / gene_product=Violaxanthin de-epoxidase, chloroplastic, putative / transcript_product=Violaxanthin de-epoxidase, chloroplastic, putative / location=Cvel_scaffold662:1348-5644(-) / protein_length=636 / sequence_SO=supercontig / SO=protein_coding / is_pseudo=false